METKNQPKEKAKEAKKALYKCVNCGMLVNEGDKGITKEMYEDKLCPKCAKPKVNGEKPARNINPAKPKETKKDIVSTVSVYLRHDFSKEEMDTMQKRLAMQTQALRHKENAKKAIVTQFGSEIETIDTEIGSLADKINTGYEHRMMKATVKYDWAKNKKYIIHPETGNTSETLDITEEDRQQKLKLEEEAKPEEKK